MKVTLTTCTNPAKNRLKVQELLGEKINDALFIFAKDMNREHCFEGLKENCKNILVFDCIEFSNLHMIKNIIVSGYKIMYRKPYTMEAISYDIGEIVIISEYSKMAAKLHRMVITHKS